MKIRESLKGLITILLIALSSSRPGLAEDRSVMHYDHPISEDLKRLDHSVPRSPINARFMGEALPLGNGRFGAIFSGHVDSEYLVFNDITLWMNSTRGASEFKQSGSPADGKDYLEMVRTACREGKFGTGEGSIESLGTEYLATKQRLGNFAPFADLEIRTGHDSNAVEDYDRALDLATGVASVRYRIGDVTYSREYFCSHPQDVFVARFSADGGKMDLVLQARTPHKKNTIESQGHEIQLRGFADMDQDDMAFMQGVRVVSSDGEVEAKSNGTLQITGATEVVLSVAGHTDFLPEYPKFKGRDFEGDTLHALQQAEELGYTVLKTNHVSDVQSLMRRVPLDLGITPSGLPTDRLVKQGDPKEVQKLYFDYSRYLQICSSRDAPVPSNLQGLWSSMLIPPWNSDYHNDINVQMNYWMVETANLPESFTPFVEWTKVLAESGRHTAWGTFGVKKGWTAGLNGNIFGFTAQNPHGRRLQQGGHWLAQHLFEHYAFNKDQAYLEDVYPVLKGAAEFFIEHLAPWKDGTLVVYPTWSPENFFLEEAYGKLNKQAWGASYDQQLLVGLFTDCIEASILLDRDPEFRQTLREFIPKLCPQKINSQGHLQEWPEDWDGYEVTHRHLSHLIALHPGRDFSPLSTPELAQACETVLKVRTGTGGWKGAWRAACWARLRNGDEALKYYNDLAFGTPNPNLLNGSRFQIDGNLGGGAVIPEMLLQSHLRSIDPQADTIAAAAYVPYRKDPKQPNHFVAVTPPDRLVGAPYILDLLPALPSAWPKGSVKGLRARGGFEVDMEWDNGQLLKATIHATRNGTFRVYSNGKLSETIAMKKGDSRIWE
ncbi:glycoside hydrolase family 95 protein [Novipirellula aureliae]|nr:glycoside hydrolase family 95 protein [Novipirellula aureliae]